MPLDNNGIIVPEWVVTCQVNFRVVAKDQPTAEAVVIRSVNIGLGMTAQVMGVGCMAQPFTKENLAQLGLLEGGPKA